MTAHCRPDRAQRYGNGAAVTDRGINRNVTIWLTPDEYRALDAIAKARDLSKTAVVRRLIHELFAAQRGPE